jgi:hypothetical protein
MSNLADRIDLPCDVEATSGAVKRLLRPKITDLGGFSVRRVLPTKGQKMLGPWVFFDHMGPASFPAGKGVNVRPHPHIGIATVTYLFEGEILHRDSLGNTQAIRPGDINLMVAGRGITHSERERPEITALPHRVHGLQLWLALPEAQEEIEPAFYHYSDSRIPAVDVEGVAIRVMMGSAYGVTSPVVTFSETLYIEADLKRGQKLILPAAQEMGLYVASGSVSAESIEIPMHTMAVLEDSEKMTVVAREETRVAIIGGGRLSPRFMAWNFVASRQDRIEEAKRHWQSGHFDKVVDDEIEFIPLPG